MTAARFRREYGCTLAEWRHWMPGATQGREVRQACDDAMDVLLGGPARLRLRWNELPPRVIAMVRLPRLQVDFEFEETTEEQRARFMRVFDLHLQRGGG